jgi:hypothetical protein
MALLTETENGGVGKTKIASNLTGVEVWPLDDRREIHFRELPEGEEPWVEIVRKAPMKALRRREK